jgi:two-component system NtrC family sensor kinase
MNFSRRLGFRLFLGIIAIITVCTGTYTIWFVNWQSEQHIQTAIRSAANISDLIARSTRYSMLLNRREDIYQIMSTIGDEPRIEGLRIYNKKGVVTFATLPQEINRTVDMSTEACNVCHLESGHIKNSDSLLTRIFKSPKGYRVLGVITPIRNSRDCSSADCHAHGNDQTVLGILDVMIPLNDTDENVATMKTNLILASFVLAGLLTIFTWLFLRKTVSRPVHDLVLGTQELVRGNLDHQIDIRRNDEIGTLAISFNEMTTELNRARTELTQWASTLEERVEAKTTELQRAQSHMVQIEKMVSLGTLAATVAHELNNPLEGILTYAKLLRKRLRQGIPSTEAAQEMIDELTMIADETIRCGNIVKHLLLFSREKVGDFKENDIRNVVEQSLKLIDHHLKIHNITFTTDLGTEPIIIHCDGHQIEEALLALEINAAEAMDDGGQLHISLRYDESKSAAEIRVTDNGCGIASEVLPHIYEPFFTTKENGKGTGLGLSVVFGIVERHSGKITVQSTAGKGTTFTISLPRYVPPQKQ